MTALDPTPPAQVIPPWTLGDRLRKAREHAGLAMGDMADLLGVHRNTIGRYEADRSLPTRAVRIIWSMKTGVPLEWIETGEPTEERRKTEKPFRGGDKRSAALAPHSGRSDESDLPYHGSPQGILLTSTGRRPAAAGPHSAKSGGYPGGDFPSRAA